jgi:hypothetical protein
MSVFERSWVPIGEAVLAQSPALIMQITSRGLQAIIQQTATQYTKVSEVLRCGSCMQQSFDSLSTLAKLGQIVARETDRTQTRIQGAACTISLSVS